MNGYKIGFIIGKTAKFIVISTVILVALFIFGFFIESGRVIPENTILYIDKQNKTYITPPCVNPNQREELKKLEHYPKNNVPEKYKDFTAAGDCTWESLKGSSTISKDILLNFGIGRDPMSRWNEDGSWNW